MSRTVRGSLGSSRVGHHEDEERDERSSSGRKKRNVERKPTFLSFFKVCSDIFMLFLKKLVISSRNRPISGVIFSLKIGLFAKPQYEISRSLRLENSEGYLSP